METILNPNDALFVVFMRGDIGHNKFPLRKSMEINQSSYHLRAF